MLQRPRWLKSPSHENHHGAEEYAQLFFCNCVSNSQKLFNSQFLLLVKRNSKLFTNLISVEQVRKNVFATLNKI